MEAEIGVHTIRNKLIVSVSLGGITRPGSLGMISAFSIL